MIPLTTETDDIPGTLGLEHCCFCGARTNLWYTPKDVAVCAGCGEVRDASEVPTKAEWGTSPQAYGIHPDLVVADFEAQHGRVIVRKDREGHYHVDCAGRRSIHGRMTPEAAIGWMANVMHNMAHLLSKKDAR